MKFLIIWFFIQFIFIIFNKTPLIAAVDFNDFDLVELLLKRNEIDLNEKGIFIFNCFNIILNFLFFSLHLK